MINFSRLKPLCRIPSLLLRNAEVSRKMSDHRTFPMEPSRWQWKKFKDLCHFYAMLGFIPAAVVITGVNIFVGPATLSEIPEDYVPKYWEYYRSPVTRFIARYILTSPQQEYEKFLAYIFMENEQIQLRKIEAAVKAKIAERNDYQAYYYRPILAKYYRQSKEAADYIESIRGD